MNILKLIDNEIRQANSDELKDFVELEDYCRRTTAANSRASVNQCTPKSLKKKNFIDKLPSAVKK